MASSTFVDREFEDDYDSAAEVDDRQHEKLLKAIHVMDNKQRIMPPSRTEPTLEISEFHLPRLNPVDINSLAASLNTKGKQYESKIAVHLRGLHKSQKVLAKPLEKVKREKIRRVVGYKNLSKRVGRWDALVQTNRAARSISFPLDNDPIQMAGSTEIVANWKSQTPSELEEGINKILGHSKVAEEDKKADEEFLLTLAELREKRREMAKLRAQLSYEAARARRMKKIKSKSYHRHLRKEKLRTTLKEFEKLQATDPEAALMELEKLEKARAQERASLRHKNSGKWARSRLIRAKYDPQTRLELAEQLAKSRDITKKLKVSDSSDEEDKKDDENSLGAKMFSEDGNNPWITVKPQSEISEFISGYRKYWETINKNKQNVAKETDASPTSEKNSPGGAKDQSESTAKLPDVDAVEELEMDINEQLKCISENDPSNRHEEVIDSSKCPTNSKTVKKVPKANLKCSEEKEDGNVTLKKKRKEGNSEKSKKKKNTILLKKKDSECGHLNISDKVNKNIVENSANLRNNSVSVTKKKKVNRSPQVKKKMLSLATQKSISVTANQSESSTKPPDDEADKEHKMNTNDQLKCISQNDSSNRHELIDTSKCLLNSKTVKKTPKANLKCSEEKEDSNVKLKKKSKKGNSDENAKKMLKRKDPECGFLNIPNKMKKKGVQNSVNLHDNSISVSIKECVVSKSPKKKAKVVSHSGTWDVVERLCTKPLKDNSNNLISQETCKRSTKTDSSSSHVELFLNSVNETSVVKSEIKGKNQKKKKTFIDVMFENAESGRLAKLQEKQTKLKSKMNLRGRVKAGTRHASNKQEANDLGASLALKSMKELRPNEDKELNEGTGEHENEKLQKLLSLASSSGGSINSTEGVECGTENLGENTAKNLDHSSRSVGNSSQDREKPKEANINPDNFIVAKPKVLLSAVPDIVDAGEDAMDDEDNGDQLHAVITEAFADDDVVDTFRKEKEDEVKKSKPQGIDLFLPGWGSWAGAGIVKRKSQKKFIVEPPPAAPRKDENKTHVFINEEVVQAIRQHQINELPHPFKSVAEYEASIRAPIGNTFIPQTAHQKLIQPTVVTKIGKIIKPLNDEFLVNKKVFVRD